jgi:hypothetical protein
VHLCAPLHTWLRRRAAAPCSNCNHVHAHTLPASPGTPCCCPSNTFALLHAVISQHLHPRAAHFAAAHLILHATEFCKRTCHACIAHCHAYLMRGHIWSCMLQPCSIIPVRAPHFMRPAHWESKACVRHPCTCTIVCWYGTHVAIVCTSLVVCQRVTPCPGMHYVLLLPASSAHLILP